MAVPTSVYTTTRVRRVLACSTFHPHAPCLAVAAQRGRVHSRNLEHLISRKALGRAGSRIHVLENSLRCNTELDVSLCSVSQRTRGRVTYIYLFLIMRRTWCSLDVRSLHDASHEEEGLKTGWLNRSGDVLRMSVLERAEETPEEGERRLGQRSEWRARPRS